MDNVLLLVQVVYRTQKPPHNPSAIGLRIASLGDDPIKEVAAFQQFHDKV